MEQINSRIELIERLKDVRAVEIKAKNSYKDDLRAFKHSGITTIINRIEQDEEYHIQLLDELINMLE